MATALGPDLRGVAVSLALRERLQRFKEHSREAWACIACVRCGSTKVKAEGDTITCEHCGNQAALDGRKFGLIYGPHHTGDVFARYMIAVLARGDEGEENG